MSMTTSTSSDPTLAAFAREWESYQRQVIEALAPLSPEQLALRAAPNLRSIAELATHVVAVRARWLHVALSEGGDEFEDLGTWDRQPGRPRTAADLVAGLERTWQLSQECLARWTPDELAETVRVRRDGQEETFVRRWVIWHLIEHDLHHGGELGYSLGMHGLPAPDI
jgi:uncharacterized damage-inducible protein DinB